MISILLACVSSVSDAEIYTELVSLEEPNAEIHLLECRSLQSESLQGDCQLAVAVHAAKAQKMPPETWCPDIDDPVWREECFFQAAEYWNEQEDPARAAMLCAKAGKFQTDCSQHLWQRALRALTWRSGSRKFAENLSTAEEIYAGWMPLLESSEDVQVRFWRRYYEGGFEREQALRPGDCDALPNSLHQDRCHRAVARIYGRRIHEIRHIPPAVRAFCAIAEPTSAAAIATGVPELQAQPSPVLDEMVVVRWSQMCAEGVPVVDPESFRPATAPPPQ